MNTPLLAEGGDSRPSLSPGPWIPPEEDSSEFSRLLEQRSTPPLLLEANNTVSGLLLPPLQRDYPPPQDNEVNRVNQTLLIYRSPLLITTATTACLLHLGFLWGSYMSEAWSETSAHLWTNWQHEYFSSSLDNHITLRTTDLASFLQDLDEAEQYPLAVLLWITSLLLPCLFMILAPAWIIHDANHSIPFLQRQKQQTEVCRSLCECTVRWVLLVFYVLVVLSVVVDSLQVAWTGTVISLQTRVLGGLTCFPVGVFSALVSLIVLRWPPRKRDQSASSSSLMMRRRPLLLAPPRTGPPPDAFENSAWQLLGGAGGLDEEAPEMTVLEDGPPIQPTLSSATEPVTTTTTTTTTTPSRQESTTTDSSASTALMDSILALFQKRTFQIFFVYQMGLLSIVLWAPSLFLPLIGWTYTGILADLDDKTTSHFYLILWELPTTLWTQGVAAGTSKSLLLLTGSVLVTTVYLLPTAVMVLACGAWFGMSPTTRERYRSWLYCLHPGLGSVVLCMAVLVTLPSLESLSRVLLSLTTGNDDCSRSDNLCPTSLLQAGLAIKGEYRPGMWLFVLQSLTLETFVVLTLRWS